MAMRGSGIRDTAKVLKTSAVTVILVLRLWFKTHLEPSFKGTYENVIIDCASQTKCGVGLVNVKNLKGGFGTLTVPVLARF